MARGNYYANGTDYRADGRRYSHELARQAKTLGDARRALDASGLAGYVQLWVERTQQRVIVCERRADGSWFKKDPHSGELVEMSPPKPREA